ncbi:hypothetical protein KFL_003300090 [Klebsormidium nitens]|uniref:DUF4440 domain-containing protein n=1 Tax=Klebsormidium nitens TaxID=105231 RepID=A0A1Y1I7Z2_KLENI|nr:hypothetical protein KFL_003300090 [Klebsormidium nitens]|eukprot:GAQ87085.1 hypothetical protein KFL_003300090 [Klebsormidium nitens]
MARAWCAALLALIVACAFASVAAFDKPGSASTLSEGAQEAVGVSPVPDCKSVIVHDQIQSRLNALSSAYANNDLEAVLRLYAEDVVVMPPGHDMFKGKTHPKFEELCIKRMKEICNCTTIYNVQEAVVPEGEEGLCGNAFVRDSFSTLNVTTQDVLTIQAGYQTTLWAKPDGVWVIKWVTWTNVMDPSPQALPPQFAM